jgi:diacylglycerol O-acyltransferase
MSTDQVTALDATFLELEEADESAHMHIGSVAIFEPQPDDRAPTIDELRLKIASGLESMPRYRQRLSEPHTGGLHWPRWVEHERFDIAQHVHVAALPAPAGEEELRRWASRYFSTRLDRARPLWEIVLVVLGDGRWAMVSKTHHSMVDGVGSVELAQTLLDTSPEAPAPIAGESDHSEEPTPTTSEQSALRRLANVPRPLVSATVGVARVGVGVAAGMANAVRGSLRTATHPDDIRDIARRARALAGVLLEDEVVRAPRSSLNEPMGGARELAVIEFALEDLKRIKNSLGGTVNDVVLAGMAGSLRQVLLERGEEPPAAGLRAMVPVNIRSAAEHLSLGNKITSLFVHLPVAEPEPLRRYRLQVQEAERLKAGDQGVGSRGIIDMAAHAPPVLHTFLARSLFATRLFNVTITNVPGPQQPLYAFGSRMTAVWPLVPLAAEHALGVAIFSYCGRVFFCFNVAADSVPDLDVAVTGLAETLAELQAIAARREAVAAASQS